MRRSWSHFIADVMGRRNGEGPKKQIVLVPYQPAGYSPAEARRCAVLMQCIRIVSSAVGRLTFKTSDRILARALKRPSGWQGPRAFLRSLAWQVLFYGSAFVERRPMGVLAPVDPRRVEITGGERPVYWYDGTEIEALHFRDTETGEVRSQPRGAEVWPAVSILLAIDDRVLGSMRRGPDATWIVTVPPTWTKDERDAYEDDLRRDYTEGGEQFGGVHVVGGGQTIDRKEGATVADMDLRNLAELKVRQVAAQYGVPPFLVGASGEEKYANAQQKTTSLITDAVDPLAGVIADTLGDAYGADVTYDLSVLMRGDLLHLAQVATRLAGGAVMTPQAAAALMGVEVGAASGDFLRSSGGGGGMGRGADERRGENAAA